MDLVHAACCGGTTGGAAGESEKQASCWVSEGTTAPAEAGGPGVSLGLFFNARHDLVSYTDRWFLPRCLVGDVGVVGWSLVENCTVDASIFVFCG